MKLHPKSSLFFLLLSIVELQATPQEVKWGKMLGSDREEYVLNHVVDDAGNIYVSGKTTGNIGGENSGKNDGFITKLDNSGNHIWSQHFGSEGEDDIQWSAIDKSGNIYITGFTTGSFSGNNHGKEDIIIVKYTSEGKQEWKKQIGTDSTDIAKGICIGSGENIYVTGVTGGKLGDTSFGRNDCFIIRLDKEGKILKTLQFGTAADDFGYSVVPGMDKDIYACGTTHGELEGQAHGFIDGFTVHFTSDLEKPLYHQFGTDGADIPLVLHADKKNGLVVAGSTSGSFASDQAGAGDCFLFRMDKKGEILWKKQFGTDQHDGVRGLDINEVSGEIIISGILNLPPEKAFVRSFSSDGILKWEKIFEGEGNNGGASGKDVHVDKRGNLTHVGLTGKPLMGPNIGQHDAYVVKMSIK